MQKSCWYCHRPLSLFKSFKGDLFCDPQHEKLYLSEQFKRVQDPFAEKAPPAKAEPDLEPPAPEAVAAVPAVEPVAVSAEPVAVEPAAVVETPPVSVSPKVPPVVTTAIKSDPPYAPLFPWPVTAGEGTRRKPVLEEAMDLVPQRVNPSLGGEAVELPNTLPLASVIAVPLSTAEGTMRQATPEEAVDTRQEPIRPRMGERPRLATAGDDIPTASSVATPVRSFEGTLPRVSTEEPIDMGAPSIDPRAMDPRVIGPINGQRVARALDFGSPSRLPLGPLHPAEGGEVQRASLPQGFENAGLSNAELAGYVPRKLSFGAAPHPELTGALSSQWTPAISSGPTQGIQLGDAISSPISFRIPNFAALAVEGTANWKAESPAPFTSTHVAQDQREDGSLASLFQASLLLTRASVMTLGRPGMVRNAAALERAGLVPEDCGSRSEYADRNPLPESVLMTLASLVTVGRAGMAQDAAAFAPAGFFSSDCGNPSEYAPEKQVPESVLMTSLLTVGRTGGAQDAGALARAGFFGKDGSNLSEYAPANPGPENVLATAPTAPPPPPPIKGSVRGLTPANPVRTRYRTIAEMSSCGNSVSSQHLSRPVALAHRLPHVQLTHATAGAQCSALHLTRPELVTWQLSGQNVAPGMPPAVESPVISAAALQFSKLQPGTVSVPACTARVAEQPPADSRETDIVTGASVHTVRSLDRRLPGGTGRLTEGCLHTGMVALRVRAKDRRVQALKASAQLLAVCRTGLPAASILLDAPALRGSSTAPLPAGSATNDRVGDFSGQQDARRTVPACLLGLPASRPRRFSPSPVPGEAFEMLTARPNDAPAPDFEAALPAAVSATTQIAGAWFSVASPVLPEHPVILNLTPIAGTAPVGTHLAQAHPRRYSPVSLLVHPRVQTPQGLDRFTAAPGVSVVTVP